MIIVLAIYIIFLIGFIIYSFFILYHLFKYGYKEDACRSMIITYILVSIVIIVITFIALAINPNRAEFNINIPTL